MNATQQTFTLTIDIGNEAMSTPEDLGSALIDLGESFHAHGSEDFGAVSLPPIRDLNGNTVGRWEIHP